MSTSTAINFGLETTRIKCGRGTLLLALDDDVLVSAEIVVGRHRTRISRAAAAALQILLGRLGEVVRYDEFGAPQASVRRDLNRVRAVLETCGLEIEAIRFVGYRLRSAAAKIPTRIIGDVALDIDGCRLIRDGRTKIIGPCTAAVLLALADADGRSMDAKNLYRSAWDAEPFQVEHCVSGRVRVARRALAEIGSAVKIQIADGRYRLQLPYVAVRRKQMPKPKKEETETGFVQMSIPLELPQPTLFDIVAAREHFAMRRRERRPRVRDRYAGCEPLFLT